MSGTCFNGWIIPHPPKHMTHCVGCPTFGDCNASRCSTWSHPIWFSFKIFVPRGLNMLTLSGHLFEGQWRNNNMLVRWTPTPQRWIHSFLLRYSPSTLMTKASFPHISLELWTFLNQDNLEIHQFDEHVPSKNTPCIQIIQNHPKSQRNWGKMGHFWPIWPQSPGDVKKEKTLQPGHQGWAAKAAYLEAWLGLGQGTSKYP